jgi:hypothetical protein
MPLTFMFELFYSTLNWIKEDYRSNPLRCALEVFAWVLSISCSIIMMLTVPHPPFLLLYPLFIIQCGVFAWAAWSRRSSGMLANYGLLVTIDTIALTRLLIM